jgi:hypothetical protein
MYKAQGCQIFLGATGKNIPNDHKIYQMFTIFTKRPQYIPKGHNIYQKATIYTKRPQYIPNGLKIYQHFRLQDPPKFTQIWIFGMKIYHLATPDKAVTDSNEGTTFVEDVLNVNCLFDTVHRHVHFEK